MATTLCPDGHPNPAGANFCLVCGKALPATNAQSENPPTSQIAPDIPDTPAPAPPGVIAAPQSPTDAKDRRRIPWAPVIISAVVLVALVGFFVLRPKHYTINGSLSAPECAGGYEIENANVEVRDQDNKLIGGTTTSFDDHGAAVCSVTFTVDVPKADRYQIKIGSHSGPSYSFDEMQTNGWRLDLSLS